MTLGQVKEVDAADGNFINMFQLLWTKMYNLVKEKEGYPDQLSEIDNSSTPFLGRSCWILWGEDGLPLMDGDGNFLPNPNSLGKSCRSERFCGWSEEYLSYGTTNNKYNPAKSFHNDTHACFAGFHFNISSMASCPIIEPTTTTTADPTTTTADPTTTTTAEPTTTTTPAVTTTVAPLEPATPRTACNQITDITECMIYSQTHADFFPFDLSCAWSSGAGNCVGSTTSSTGVTEFLEIHENNDAELTVIGAIQYRPDYEGYAKDVYLVGAGGYAYDYNDGDLNKAKIAAATAAVEGDSGPIRAQLWNPTFPTLQYEEEHRIPFVEKDTCFIISDIIYPTLVEQSYISPHSYMAPSTTIYQCELENLDLGYGKCKDSYPYLKSGASTFFQSDARYEYISKANTNGCSESAECKDKRTAILELTSATRAPSFPSSDMLNPVTESEQQYTHALLGDRLGRPFLYKPCVSSTTLYLEALNDYTEGEVKASTNGVSFFAEST